MEQRLIIVNGLVVTMDESDTVLSDATVVIEGDRIVAVGTDPALALAGPGDTIVDADNKAVLPGLVDLHYHTALGKGYSDNLPLWEYLETLWYPLIRALDDEAAYWAALLSYSESIKCGVTTVNDMYRRLPALAQAAGTIGMRAVLANDVADDEHDLDTLHDNAEAFAQCHGAHGGLVEVRIGIEWLPLSSRELLVEARALADELGTGIHVHLNESLSEVESSMERFGQRPTEVAYDSGLLGPDCVAAHCVWLSDREIALMRETGTHISHNPSSNAKLGNGIARVPEILAAGINMGLGHDAAECNNSRDMFEVMKFASLMHRASRVDASLQQPRDVLRQATRNGSIALGHDTGQLVAGAKADVILVDLRSQMFTPLEEGNTDQLFSHLVFAANGTCVDTTIIDGKVVMAGRQLTTVDEAEVLREANAAFARTLARMERPRSINADRVA
jgi:5-methylthioadenosine/S-adenosylhomocysteine deaminase